MRGKRGENAPKVLQLDADFLRDLSDELSCVPLSQRTAFMLLSLLEYQKMGKVYGTRWKGSYTWDEVQTWVDAAAKQLMDICEGNVTFQLRQNSVNRCLLEQSTDGGQTWTTAFDYSICLAEPLVRFDENANMEISEDGGTTWRPANPDEDPRQSATDFPPLLGADGDAKRCEAARNAAGYLMDNINNQIASRGTGAILSELAAVALQVLIVLGIIGSGGVLAPLLLAIAAALLTYTYAELAAAFDSTTQQTLLCILYCNFEIDGTISVASLEIVKAEIQFQLNATAADILIQNLNAMGIKGINNASRLSQSLFTSDCSECTSCQQCAGTTLEELTYRADVNQDKFSLGYGVRNTGSSVCRSLVYATQYAFEIDLEQIRCVGALKINGYGSSMTDWPSGMDWYLDGRFIGHVSGFNACVVNAWSQGDANIGRLTLDPKVQGRHLRCVATEPTTGNQTGTYGVSIVQVLVRVYT